MTGFSNPIDFPTLYTIPLGVSFADAFATEILDRHGGGDPLGLADVTILLPNRRSVRALQDAFLRATAGRTGILPVMRPVGDVDEDHLVQTGLGPMEHHIDLPPDIPPLQRQMLLARQIMRLERHSGQAAAGAGQAMRLAADLARLIDQVQIEGLDFNDLGNLVPEHLARHWQVTVSFLSIISKNWPSILAATGYMDPADRRNRLLDGLARHWRDAPPTGPVYAAGSTGTIPATARLLGTISRLRRGAVVLPGLDLDLDDDSWTALDHTHPQFAMKRLLDTIGASREDVRPWPLTSDQARMCKARHHRLDMARQALRPAATIGQWRGLSLDSRKVWDGLVRLDCPGPREEAGVIALLMREALEDDGKITALVTADRSLARRVAAELRRWNIEIDDSAGMPLAVTRSAAFMRLLTAVLAEDYAPVPLLSALKHPLAAAGRSPKQFRSMVRRWERAFLRGPRPAGGRQGLIAAARQSRQELRRGDLTALTDLLKQFRSLESLVSARSIDLGKILEKHISLAEVLAQTDADPGPDRLWKGEDGNALADWLAEIRSFAGDLGRIPGVDYLDLFDSLLEGRVIRPVYGTHPRLHIWGTLEARLQQPDRMILGGLNEGSWPPEVGDDPWMSRPMRDMFGLPPLERRIGQSAQDFLAAMGAREVFLTRAAKVDGTPTVPSRWLMRMEAMAGKMPDASARWLGVHAALDRPERNAPVGPPQPRPPVAARPNRLSVTQVETWMRDPYAVYARHILGLRALDPLDADPGAADRGIIVHDALDRFFRQEVLTSDGVIWPSDAMVRLIGIANEVFRPLLARPAVWAFWWPRFEAIARWMCETEPARLAGATPLATETRAEAKFSAGKVEFTLTATADRIDRLADGRLSIIDYKTGGLPSNKQIDTGFAPQLPLEGVLAARGAFDRVPKRNAGMLAFWQLRGTNPVVIIREIKDPQIRIKEAEAGLVRLIAEFSREDTPYLSKPRPVMANPGDFDHLARIKEWRDSDAGETD